MSGRIRTIKPELLDDAITAGLTDMAFRLFVSSIVLADDYGRLRAEPSWLMGQIYWARSIQTEDFLEAIKELGPLVRFYEIKGQRYAAIRNWEKHQKISHRSKPRVPAPPEDLANDSGDPPESLRPDLRPTTNDQRPTTTTAPPSRAEPPPLPELAEPVSEKAPPTWWGDACHTVETQTGAKINRGAAWLRYYGHRAGNGKRISRPDAVYFLTTVDAREAAKDREERRRQDARDARFAPRGSPPEPAAPPTEAEARANAQRLAERIAARKARESKGAA